MQVNGIRQVNVRNNSDNNRKECIPVFKGAKEIELAKKIVHKHMSIAAAIGATLPSSLCGDEVALVANGINMAKEISKIYNIKNLDAIKDVITGLVNRQVGLRLFPCWPIGGFHYPAYAAGVTYKVGDDFIKLCEKDPQIAEKLSKGARE